MCISIFFMIYIYILFIILYIYYIIYVYILYDKKIRRIYQELYPMIKSQNILLGKLGSPNFSGRQPGLPGRQACELPQERSYHHAASRLKKWWLSKNHAAKTMVTMQQNQPRPSKTIQNHLKQPSKTI